MVYVNLLIGLGIATVVAFAYFNWNTVHRSPSSRQMLLNDRQIESRSLDDLCTICLDPLSGLMVYLRCKHALHEKCFYQYQANGGRQCPVCRMKIDV
ncbi:E3 ubiquitin-protein ligase RING2-A [Drosophila simulans]|uniref:GD20672 n=1 Tax=Drosophila simulans TaxID=7240 RepID=B4QU63_DROSI|nr:E3 ubiquitin-protein ligase RING2-A [Drosophila simulans]EDX13394.1 GD20672 [Drosophila simulans]KMZ04276.1 uncharacterized protein Dsimw501_GD20672 [Drosophila simulans]